MTSRSEQIRERLFECIHKGELEDNDLVKIFEYIGNDILQLKTKSNLHKGKISKITGWEKSYNSHKWAKGKNGRKAKRAYIDGVEFISDNE